MNAPVDLAKLLKEGATAMAIPEDVREALKFSVRRKIVKHTGFKRAFDEIARLHYRGVHAKVAEGLLLVAQSGAGKSTLIEYYEGLFPRSRKDGVLVVPVLRVETPEAPSVKSLAESILMELGDVYASKGNATEKTRRIVHLCKECGVQLLIFDEFQHFADRGTSVEAGRVTDWLKLLLIKLEVPVLLVGLPRSVGVVNSNRQLRRRFASPLHLEPFEFSTLEGQREFRGVLKAIGRELTEGSVRLDDAKLAVRFFYASNGLIDYLIKIVDDAVSRGGSGAHGAVTLADLAAAFRNAVWSTVPERLNPFSERPQLRPLTRAGEPFEGWDDVAYYLYGPGTVQLRHSKAGAKIKGKTSANASASH